MDRSEILERPAGSRHAAARGRVRYTAGRKVALGTLVYWPSPGKGRAGAKATVLSATGHHLSIPCDDIELLEVTP